MAPRPLHILVLFVCPYVKVKMLQWLLVQMALIMLHPSYAVKHVEQIATQSGVIFQACSYKKKGLTLCLWEDQILPMSFVGF